MSKILIAICAALAVFASACSPAGEKNVFRSAAIMRNGTAGASVARSTHGQTVLVQIPRGAKAKGSSAFGPNPLIIPKGTTVIWSNTDSVRHTTTSDAKLWDSKAMNPGTGFAFTFNKPGTYSYHSALDGSSSMSGVIQVK